MQSNRISEFISLLDPDPPAAATPSLAREYLFRDFELVGRCLSPLPLPPPQSREFVEFRYLAPGWPLRIVDFVPFHARRGELRIGITLRGAVGARNYRARLRFDWPDKSICVWIRESDGPLQVIDDARWLIENVPAMHKCERKRALNVFESELNPKSKPDWFTAIAKIAARKKAALRMESRQ